MTRGTVHTFRNPGAEPLHILIQTIPGGFDRFFAECEVAFSAGGEPDMEPDMEEIIAISARYGIHYPAL